METENKFAAVERRREKSDLEAKKNTDRTLRYQIVTKQ